MAEKIIKTLNLGDNNVLKLSFDPLYLHEDGIDLNKLLFIDYANLAAEIATFTIPFASVGFMLSDLKKETKKAELNLKIFKSKFKKDYRAEMTEYKLKFTTEMPDDEVRSTPQYKIENLKHINALHRESDMDTLYWSMKEKSQTLQNLAKSYDQREFVDALLNTSIREINFVNLRLMRPSVR